MTDELDDATRKLAERLDTANRNYAALENQLRLFSGPKVLVRAGTLAWTGKRIICDNVGISELSVMTRLENEKYLPALKTEVIAAINEALEKMDPDPEEIFRDWFKTRIESSFDSGEIQWDAFCAGWDARGKI